MYRLRRPEATVTLRPFLRLNCLLALALPGLSAAQGVGAHVDPTLVAGKRLRETSRRRIS